jgi:hypothetical protein
VSTFDYDEIREIAEELIEEFGRQITFVQLDSTASTPSKPWRANTAPRGNPVQTLQLYGVFVEPESLERLGKQRVSNDFIKSAEQVIIVAFNGSLGDFDEVIDSDGSRWTVHNIQELAPGDSGILHYFRAQRRGHITPVRGALL